MTQDDITLSGYATNAPLHAAILDDDMFRKGGVGTNYLPRPSGLDGGPVMSDVTLLDTTVRDGNQSNWGPRDSIPARCY